MTLCMYDNVEAELCCSHTMYVNRVRTCILFSLFPDQLLDRYSTYTQATPSAVSGLGSACNIRGSSTTIILFNHALLSYP